MTIFFPLSQAKYTQIRSVRTEFWPGALLSPPVRYCIKILYKDYTAQTRALTGALLYAVHIYSPCLSRFPLGCSSFLTKFKITGIKSTSYSNAVFQITRQSRFSNLLLEKGQLNDTQSTQQKQHPWCTQCNWFTIN